MIIKCYYVTKYVQKIDESHQTLFRVRDGLGQRAEGGPGNEASSQRRLEAPTISCDFNHALEQLISIPRA